MRTSLTLVALLVALGTAGCVNDMVGVTSDAPDVFEDADVETPDAGAAEVPEPSEDWVAPTVEITLPERGSFVTGPLLLVEGRALGGDVIEVDIGGDVVPVAEDGSFSYSTEVPPGAYHIRVSATDEAGNTGYAMTSALVGAFLPVEELIDRAAVLQLGETALAEIGDGIAPLISPRNLEPAILSYGRLVSGFWGWLEAEGYDHGLVAVDVVPGPGTLTVTVTVDDIRLPLRADLRIGPDITGTASVDRAVATVVARVAAVDGRPVVTVTETDVRLYGLLIDIDGLWSWIDRNIVTSLVRGRVGDELDALVSDRVPTALANAIERIPTTQVVRLAGRSVVIRGEVRSLLVSRSGIRLMLDLGVNPVGGDSELLSRVPGFLTVDPGYPNTSTTPDVRAQINLDLVNAALFAAWSTGGLEATLVQPVLSDSGPLTAGVLAYLAPRLRGSVPTDAPVTVSVAPVLPPVVTSTEEDETLLEARIPDLSVVFTAEVDGADVPLFELAIGVSAPARVSIIDDEIGIDASRWTLVAETIGEDVGLPEGADLDAFLTALLAPRLEDLVRIDGLRVPQLYGFDATDLSLDLDDGFLVAEARLMVR